jgi:hypothetical protein
MLPGRREATAVEDAEATADPVAAVVTMFGRAALMSWSAALTRS